MITNLVPEKAIISGKKLQKRIDSGAEQHIMRMVQSNIYSKPLESCIRETVSNGVDGNHEKLNAIKILNGINKIEDFYYHQEGGLYKDSKFDPSYFDLKFLDQTNNSVEIHYEENFTGEDTGFCDMLRITDFGVGISAQRLIGMTNVGFSTKRSANVSLGALTYKSSARSLVTSY